MIQVADSKVASVHDVLDRCGAGWVDIGTVDAGNQLTIYNDDEVVLRLNRTDMQRAWSETTCRMQALRDNPETAREEFDRILDADDPGLNVRLTFDPDEDIAAPYIGGARPAVAVLREQGVNSHYEMAAAFMRAGFKTVDVHMSDLVSGRDSLASYQGIVACGGFSFGDVLGAGGGWAKSILFQSKLADEFAAFFGREDTFTLGVCNGSRIPIATSHGEGRAVFASDADRSRANVALRYVDNYGAVATQYPANPNGSVDGICGLVSDDGRATIMMPHPERVARTVQNSWHPDEWGEDGPWLRMFRNARAAVA